MLLHYNARIVTVPHYTLTSALVFIYDSVGMLVAIIIMLDINNYIMANSING